MLATKSANRGLAIYLAIASALCCLLAMYYLVKGKAFAFYDFGSDTLYQYYPVQLAFSRQLHRLHEFTWSFELGLGGYLGTIFDPFWLVTGWLPESWQLPLRLPMYLLHLVLGGAFICGYLRLIGLRPLLCVIGGLGFAFSSYGTLNAQWDILYDTDFLQLAIFLYCAERYFRHGQRWAAVAAGVATGLGPPIVVYMLGLFCLIYAAARLIAVAPAQRREALLRIATFVPWCAIGLALTAPALFPSLYYLLESPRVIGEHSELSSLLGQIQSLNEPSVIGWQFAGLVGKDLLGTGLHYAGWQNYFEGPGFYVGLLPLLCVPQLFGPNASRAERTLALIGVSGCLLYFIWPALRYAVYGFGHQAFRFSTLWISVLLLVLGLAGLQRALLSGWWRRGIMAGAGLVIAIVVAIAWLAPKAMNLEHGLHVVAFVAAYTTLLLSASTSGGRPWSFEYLLVALSACELLIFAIPPVIERDAVNADGSSPQGRYDDATLHALKFIRDSDASGEFFRIEKTYLSVFLNDALVQGYFGTAQYYFNADSPTRFVDRMELPRYVLHPNYISPMTPRHRVLDLVGVRYVLTRNRDLDNSGMTYLRSVDGVDVYLNTRAHAFGTFYDTLESESDADLVPVPKRDDLLLTRLVVEDRAGVESKLAALRTASGRGNVGRRAEIKLVRDDQLQGIVEAPEASPLLLAMPFDAGWRAWLDGVEVGLFRAQYGLTALCVPPGSHSLALSYSPPGRALGFSVMAGAVAFLAVFGLFPALQRKTTRLSWRWPTTRLRGRAARESALGTPAPP